MADGQPVPGSLWIYAPNQGAPVFFAVAFAISAVFHIWQCRRYKAFKLIGLHPLCAVIFTVGYALREYGSFNYIYDPKDKSILFIFIVSQVFIYVCPPLLELANYHVLGRTFYYVPHLAPLPPGRVLATFGGLMALVEALNAIGVALVANPSSRASTQELGKHLTIASLAIQLGIIATFAVLSGLFHSRCASAKIRSRAVWTTLITLYVSMGLILARSIFRTIEHTGNTTVRLRDPEALRSLSPLLRYEWYFYVFEATLMLLNSVLWNIWNPGRYLPKNAHLSTDGVTELEAAHQVDERSFLAKTGHVLTFGICFRNTAQNRQFQELRDNPGDGRIELLGNAARPGSGNRV